MEKLKALHSLYYFIKEDIAKKLEEFKSIGKDEGKVFKELIFCILTPQSKAEICWNAVERMFKKNIVPEGSVDEIARELKGVRFRFNKARYIVEARKFFNKNFLRKLNDMDAVNAREWLVKNIKGYGYKEASHFLRNIGKGFELAILDRHILKNLVEFSVIDNIPALTKKKYYEIEKKMREFSERIGIPMAYLDFVLWHRQTGRIFK
ncbi:MAG: N-glycosylase/DNA lyase [Thermoplasmata archaeon]|nr:MAG: N-glycosylase/DNA lyase [Thermoplasmata archaeon]